MSPYHAAQLPPDVVSASWSWSYELAYVARGISRVYGVGPTHTYLTCEVKLTDTDDYSDLVVRAAHDNGHQTASLSYTARRPRVYSHDFDRSQVLQTSQSLIRHRITTYKTNADLRRPDAVAVQAYAEPGDVVAFVKSLEMYARDEVWF